MYKAIVITVSDRCYKDERVDLSAPVLEELLIKHDYNVLDNVIVPDETEAIINALNLAVSERINLIVTTGGTGFSRRDITPECTKQIIEREALGVAEYMRYSSMQITKRAMLSRGTCGIRNDSVIINLPGSPKAAFENLSAVIDTLRHALDTLCGNVNDCAR